MTIIDDIEFSDEIQKFIGRLSSQESEGTRCRRPRKGTPGARGRSVSPNPSSYQRVVVVLSPGEAGKGGGKSRAHLGYLQREGAGKSGAPELFGSALLYKELNKEAGIEVSRTHFFDRGRQECVVSGVLDLKELTTQRHRVSPLGRKFVERCSGDEGVFRIILSPERGDKLDLERFTYDLMRDVEPDLSTRLEWVAVEHHNTDSPHVHVVIRRVTDDGRPLYLSPKYISHSIRRRAEAAATRQLGRRKGQDLAHSEQKQVSAHRFTDLDREILDLISAQKGAGKAPILTAKVRRVIRQRLQFLASHCLSKFDKDTQTYSIAPALEAKLRELERTRNVHHRLSRCKRRDAHIISLSDGYFDPPIIGRLVARGFVSDASNREYIVLETLGGESFHMEPTRLFDASELSPGRFARFSSTKGNLRMVPVSKSAVHSQVHAHGVTWLDTDILKLVGTQQGMAARILLQVHAARQVFLRERGLGRHKQESNKHYFSRLRRSASLHLLSNYALSQGAVPAGLHAARVVSGRLHPHVIGMLGDTRRPIQDGRLMYFLPPVASLDSVQNSEIHVLVEPHPAGPSLAPRVHLLGQSVDSPRASYYTEHDKQLQLLLHQAPGTAVKQLPDRLQKRLDFFVEVGLVDANPIISKLPSDLETRLKAVVIRSRVAKFAQGMLSTSTKPVGPCVIVASGEELGRSELGWVLLEDAHGDIHHRSVNRQGPSPNQVSDCVLWVNDSLQSYAPTQEELASLSSQPIDYVLAKAPQTREPTLANLATKRAIMLQQMGVDPYRSDLVKVLRSEQRRIALASWCSKNEIEPTRLGREPFFGEVKAELLLQGRTYMLAAPPGLRLRTWVNLHAHFGKETSWIQNSNQFAPPSKPVPTNTIVPNCGPSLPLIRANGGMKGRLSKAS